MNIYLHIPFCRSRCTYCHFNSTTDHSQITEYMTALQNELNLRLPSSLPVHTVYFGGGTPSLLPIKLLSPIIKDIQSKSTVTIDEMTLEINPDTVTESYIDQLIDLGFNRLSFGIQSWQKPILVHMNRSTDIAHAHAVISHARTYPNVSINLDHIIGYPGQTAQSVVEDMKKSLALKPDHLSIYPLEIHPYTPIHRLLSDKQIRRSTKRQLVHQFAKVQTYLIKSGYLHYEEFSFCLPKKQCLHNTDFWQGNEYLGLGLSSGSRIGHQIITNTGKLNEYVETLSKNQLPPQITQNITASQLKTLNRDLKSRLLI